MNRVQELDAIVAQFDLNTHPFYVDWRMGTLPKEKLVDYSGEYGRFVATIADGWETTGHPHYAEEEREHDALWQEFRAEIGFRTASDRPETDVLETAARRLFSDAATAPGALYAFEAQQPKTAQSKLDGLNEHYAVTERGKEYFRVHASDFAEAEELRRVVEGMSEADFARTKTACAVMCATMWSALDAVYYGRAVAHA